METMYYIGLDCAQEDDQLLRKGRKWPRLRRRFCSCHPFWTGPVDETLRSRGPQDGSHDVFRLDLRSSETARRGSEGGAPA